MAVFGHRLLNNGHTTMKSYGNHITASLVLTAVLALPDELPGDTAFSKASYRMVAGVSWYGPCDVEKMDLFNDDDRADFQDWIETRIMGSDSSANDKLTRYREVSPVNYLSKDSPLLLMI